MRCEEEEELTWSKGDEDWYLTKNKGGDESSLGEG